jgi:hypothetical protein
MQCQRETQIPLFASNKLIPVGNAMGKTRVRDIAVRLAYLSTCRPYEDSSMSAVKMNKCLMQWHAVLFLVREAVVQFCFIHHGSRRLQVAADLDG